ncbi:MAG: ribosomal RNA small subunit methyltransferase A [Thermoplasmatales archaeon]|nr:MAG: ribosomal RNA small subunit methyltransferase A [Thermoplasmatales archaeon]
MKNKLGQIFLTDKKTAEREVKYANIKQDDVVLEIGPGNGILTKLLSKKAKKVIAIELDNNLVNELKKTLSSNVELIHGNALEIDFNKFKGFNKVVANLPFQISSPITFKLLDYDFDLAVLIYQKEFAERMIAKPGNKNYSRLSVNIYYKSICEILEHVPKTNFKPQPKVDSSIVRIIPRYDSPFKVYNEQLFFDITKKFFSHRRKKIKTILKNRYKDYINQISFLENRVEDLTPEQIGKISNELFDINRLINQ